MTNTRFLTTLFAILLLLTAATLRAQNVNDGFDPMGASNGDIYAIEESSGVYYIGGNFTQIGGGTRSGIARLWRDGSLETGFAPAGVKLLSGGLLFPGTVRAIAVQPDGKVVIAGSFTEVNGVARNNIARLDPNGNLDPTFTTSVTGNVVASMAMLPDGGLVIGGDFTAVNGSARSLLARLDANGGLDATTALNSNGTVVYALERDAATGKIYAGGIVNGFGPTTIGSFARLNEDGRSVDTSFSTSLSSGADAIAFQKDGRIVVGSSTGVTRFFPDGSTDSSLNIGTGSWVESVAIQNDGKILIGGFFTSINGTPRNHVARLNFNGSLDATFDPNVGYVSANNGRISTIFAENSQRIIFGGRFTTVGGLTRNGLARIVADGAVDGTANLATTTGVPLTFLPLANGKALVGGNFTALGGQTYAGLARIKASGEVDTTFPNLAIVGEVDDIAALPDGKWLIAGSFTSVSGQARQRLARLNANFTLDTTFAPAINNTVLTVAVQNDGGILIGGFFTTVNTNAANGIARLTSTGAMDTTFAPNLDQGLYRIRIQSDNKILIGGFFSTVTGVSRKGIARLNTNGTLDSAFNPVLGGVISEVVDIAIQRDDKIVIGGSFPSVNGNSNNSNIARLFSNGTLDTGFSGRADSTVNAIALQSDGAILVGGRFLNLNSVAKSYVGQFNENGTLVDSFTLNASDTVTALALQGDGKILIGGNFATIGGQTRTRFARAANLRNSQSNELFYTSGPNLAVWNIYGGVPVLNRVTVEISSDGVNFTSLGTALKTTSWAIYSPLLAGRFVRFRGVFPDYSNLESQYESVWYVTPRPTLFDFDGDRKTDIGIFRQTDGSWWYSRSVDNQPRVYRFGVSTDTIVPADYTGDGKTDIAVFRNGTWFVQRSEDNSFFSFPFGTTGDIPAPADYDGDGFADPAVFRPSNGTWYISRTSDLGTTIAQFGSSADKPVTADYDGDGRSDIAIFRPSDGSWWYVRSSDQTTRVFRFGVGTDKPEPGDWTGDGKADICIFRPSTGEWFVQRSEDGSFFSFPFGAAGDVPTAGDFDGDGRFDAAVFRNGTWFVNRSSAGLLISSFGASGDRPVPNAFVP